jgi:hypothetical protein
MRHTGIEAFLVFLTIMICVWSPQFLKPLILIVVGSAILMSWVLREDSLMTLGFFPPQKWRGLSVVLFLVLLNFFILLALNRSFCRCGFQKWGAPLYSLQWYFCWALIQQTVLCGYFANRIAAANFSDHLVALVCAVFFAAIHVPNPALTLLTLVNGYASVRIFLQFRNIYFLGFSHFLIGYLAQGFLSVGWHKMFQIGLSVLMSP